MNKKKYDILSIGDALVDLEFNVNENFLKELNLPKGKMTLIDHETYHNLIEDLIGIQHVKACGGSAANSIITAQLLGATTFYCGRVAKDEYGQFFYEDLKDKGVSTNIDKKKQYDGHTGKCIVMLTPDGERTMSTFKGISEYLSLTDLCDQTIQNSKYLFTEGYLVTLPSTFAVALKAHELAYQYGIKRVLSLSDCNVIKKFKNNLLLLMKNPVDLLFCNEQEALDFCQTTNLEKAKTILLQYAKTFTVTLGKKGSITYDGHQSFYSPAIKTDFVDSLGAGDIFAGTFLYGLSRGYSYEAANRLSNIAASRIVSKTGPRINQHDAEHILECV